MEVVGLTKGECGFDYGSSKGATSPESTGRKSERLGDEIQIQMDLEAPISSDSISCADQLDKNSS